MPNSPTEKSGKLQLNLNVRADLVNKFRDVCRGERRLQNAQMELILEEWFAARESSYMSDVKKLHVAEERKRYGQATGDLFGLMALGGWSSMGSVKVYQHLTKTRFASAISVNYRTNPAPKKG